MDKEHAIEYVANVLGSKGAKIYEYSGVRFVAILNGNGKSNLAITFGDENMTMEFATQSARFAYGDEDDLVAHTEKFLSGELCAVEFYHGETALFGGSRIMPEKPFDTTSELAAWYACGNAEAEKSIDEFLKKNEIVVVCAVWTVEDDLMERSSADGKMIVLGREVI